MLPRRERTEFVAKSLSPNTTRRVFDPEDPGAAAVAPFDTAAEDPSPSGPARSIATPTVTGPARSSGPLVIPTRREPRSRSAHPSGLVLAIGSTLSPAGAGVAGVTERVMGRIAAEPPRF